LFRFPAFEANKIKLPCAKPLGKWYYTKTIQNKTGSKSKTKLTYYIKYIRTLLVFQLCVGRYGTAEIALFLIKDSTNFS
jgi:hypothetical protein